MPHERLKLAHYGIQGQCQWINCRKAFNLLLKQSISKINTRDKNWLKITVHLLLKCRIGAATNLHVQPVQDSETEHLSHPGPESLEDLGHNIQLIDMRLSI